VNRARTVMVLPRRPLLRSRAPTRDESRAITALSSSGSRWSPPNALCEPTDEARRRAEPRALACYDPIEKGDVQPVTVALTHTGRVLIDASWCKECAICVNVCPKDVFEQDVHGQVVPVRDEACVYCDLCVLFCPDFAITLVRFEEASPHEPEGEASAEEAPQGKEAGAHAPKC